MRLLLDENLSPDLARVAHERGSYATSSRDLDWLGLKDHELIPRCIDNDFALCTTDGGDPPLLAAAAGLHPGLILIAECGRDRSIQPKRSPTSRPNQRPRPRPRQLPHPRRPRHLRHHLERSRTHRHHPAR